MLLGPSVRPIFTPPWNRCTLSTAECLVELGFRVLSRDSSAGELVLPGLAELPITFDWFAKCKGELLSRAQRGDLLAQRIASTRTVGIMLHHALMDPTNWSRGATFYACSAITATPASAV